ncbi:MAG: hypothetical protein ACI89X_003620 [Planctomycetota bacterium]|jgi:hypothetical protein
MHMWTLSIALLFGACHVPAALAVPVDVVADGEFGVVIAHEVLDHSSVGEVCQRAASYRQWLELCESYDDTLAKRDPREPNFNDEQLVMVSLPPMTVLTGIVVSSEEGVDVITLDVGLRGVSRTACLLRMSRRSCQMAIVVRDQQGGAERTVAVFSGL